MRQKRFRTLEDQLQLSAHQLKAGRFDKVVNVSGSPETFAFVADASLSWNEFDQKGFFDAVD